MIEKRILFDLFNVNTFQYKKDVDSMNDISAHKAYSPRLAIYRRLFIRHWALAIKEKWTMQSLLYILSNIGSLS